MKVYIFTKWLNFKYGCSWCSRSTESFHHSVNFICSHYIFFIRSTLYYTVLNMGCYVLLTAIRTAFVSVKWKYHNKYFAIHESFPVELRISWNKQANDNVYKETRGLVIFLRIFFIFSTLLQCFHIFLRKEKMFFIPIAWCLMADGWLILSAAGEPEEEKI